MYLGSRRRFLCESGHPSLYSSIALYPGQKPLFQYPFSSFVSSRSSSSRRQQPRQWHQHGSWHSSSSSSTGLRVNGRSGCFCDRFLFSFSASFGKSFRFRFWSQQVRFVHDSAGNRFVYRFRLIRRKQPSIVLRFVFVRYTNHTFR